MHFRNLSSIQNFIASTEGLSGYTVQGPSDDWSNVPSENSIIVFGPNKTAVLQFNPDDFDKMEEGIRKLYMQEAKIGDRNEAIKNY